MDTKSNDHARRSVRRLGLLLLVLVAAAGVGCRGLLESMLEDLAEKSDPGQAGARSDTLERWDVYGNPIPPRERRAR